MPRRRGGELPKSSASTYSRPAYPAEPRELAALLGVTLEHCGAIKEDEGSQDTATARMPKRTQNHSRAISFALESAHLYGRRNRWRHDQ